MAQKSPFAHIPSSQDGSKTVLQQTPAVIVGALLTLLVGVPLAFYGLGQVLDVIGHLIWFIIAAYVVALTIQFWVAQSWKNGMTSKEITYTVLWPLDVIRSIRQGLRAAAGQIPGRNPRDTDDIGKKVLSQQAALIVGIVATVIAIPLLFVGISTALTVIGSLIWLCIIAYLVGMFVQFWVAQSWRDGLTVKELTMAAIWPVGMLSLIRAGAKRFRQ